MYIYVYIYTYLHNWIFKHRHSYVYIHTHKTAQPSGSNSSMFENMAILSKTIEMHSLTKVLRRIWVCIVCAFTQATTVLGEGFPYVYTHIYVYAVVDVCYNASIHFMFYKYMAII
jgi:hypothetical protein